MLIIETLLLVLALIMSVTCIALVTDYMISSRKHENGPFIFLVCTAIVWGLFYYTVKQDNFKYETLSRKQGSQYDPGTNHQ